MTAKASLIACLALFCASGCAFEVDPDDPTPSESAETQAPVGDSVASDPGLPSVDPAPASCVRFQTIALSGTLVTIPLGCSMPGRDLGDPAPLMPEPSDPLGNPSPYALPAEVEHRDPPPETWAPERLPAPDGDRRPPD
jgi:hypothetical protein